MAPAAGSVQHEGRAALWAERPDGVRAVLRVRFEDATATMVVHDLDLVVPVEEAARADRRRLLLLGSRQPDVRSYVRRLADQGWREVARAVPPGTTYALSLVEGPTG
ncbi:hypothetical protein [Nocardioides marmotae]|uniref:hypothetical protein n=1 Tax=Nocardioides marmotae TaxID=2663857 RepID=UPI0012B52A7F|nr:hypothetical protein [Nocardioides marmotae]MBC9734581.1 hypothetical protein [Nocardioides marmotae]MTB85682.1 hypothetical protein [Nocardioides marmotae]